ncbi:MAG: hypothetical protein ACTHZ5_09990 [Micrococcaceae bacterium]
MFWLTAPASQRSQCCASREPDAVFLVRNLSRTFPVRPTAGYENDSWSGEAIGWWGGEP